MVVIMTNPKVERCKWKNNVFPYSVWISAGCCMRGFDIPEQEVNRANWKFNFCPYCGKEIQWEE